MGTFSRSPQGTCISYLCFSLADVAFRKEAEARKAEGDIEPPHPPSHTSPWSKHCCLVRLSGLEHGRGRASRCLQISRWAPEAPQGRPLEFTTRPSGVLTLLLRNLNLEMSHSPDLKHNVRAPLPPARGCQIWEGGWAVNGSYLF